MKDGSPPKARKLRLELSGLFPMAVDVEANHERTPFFPRKPGRWVRDSMEDSIRSNSVRLDSSPSSRRPLRKTNSLLVGIEDASHIHTVLKPRAPKTVKLLEASAATQQQIWSIVALLAIIVSSCAY